MASEVVKTVTKTVSAAATSAAPAQKVASQGGVLEGANPSVFDPNNPIVLFIIQVSRRLLTIKQSLTLCSLSRSA